MPETIDKMIPLQTKVEKDVAELVFRSATQDLRSVSAWVRLAVIEKLERERKPKK